MPPTLPQNAGHTRTLSFNKQLATEPPNISSRSTFIKTKINKTFGRIYFSSWVWECVHEFRYPWRTEEDIGSPGGGVTCDCEPPDMGTGNRIWVLWKGSTCS